MQLYPLLYDTLIATEQVHHAAIIRKKDSSVRAASVGFSMSDAEVQRLIQAFKNASHIREHGLFVGEKKYTAIRADNSGVYGKDGSQGVICSSTNGFIIVGTYDASMYPSVTVEAVEKLAAYFREKSK